jgi:hypothetical protein
MMQPELLALWHVALAEALLLVALLVAINGLDDLAIDALWLMMPRLRRQPQPLPPAPPPVRFAILIPAWDESAVIGAMLESNLVGGNQKFPRPLSELTRGQSITDACISWETTEALLREVHGWL